MSGRLSGRLSGRSARSRGSSGTSPTALSQLDVPSDVEIHQKIGSGSFGSVFAGTFQAAPAALKAVPIEPTQDGVALSGELQSEIKLLKQCDSDWVVKYIGCLAKNQTLWIAMELCDASVSDVLRRTQTPLSEEEIACVAAGVVRGLDYLHNNRAILHRDVKAGNVLLTHVNGGGIKLCDLGVSASISSHTKRSTVIGTPLWMSPELIESGAYGTSTDIWSLGITVIEMAELTPPHSQVNPTIRALFLISSNPSPTLAQEELWSADLVSFANSCLIKDPKQRASASALLSHPLVRRGCAGGMLPVQDILARFASAEVPAHCANSSQEATRTVDLMETTCVSAHEQTGGVAREGSTGDGTIAGGTLCRALPRQRQAVGKDGTVGYGDVMGEGGAVRAVRKDELHAEATCRLPREEWTSRAGGEGLAGRRICRTSSAKMEVEVSDGTLRLESSPPLAPTLVLAPSKEALMSAAMGSETTPTVGHDTTIGDAPRTPPTTSMPPSVTSTFTPPPIPMPCLQLPLATPSAGQPHPAQPPFGNPPLPTARSLCRSRSANTSMMPPPPPRPVPPPQARVPPVLSEGASSKEVNADFSEVKPLVRLSVSSPTLKQDKIERSEHFYTPRGGFMNEAELERMQDAATEELLQIERGEAPTRHASVAGTEAAAQLGSAFCKLCQMATVPRGSSLLLLSREPVVDLYLKGLTSPDADVQQSALMALLALRLRNREPAKAMNVTLSMLETIFGMVLHVATEVRRQALQLLNALAVDQTCVRYLCQPKEFTSVLGLPRILSEEKSDYVAAERALQIVNALVEAERLTKEQVEEAKRLITPMVTCKDEAVSASAAHTLEVCDLQLDGSVFGFFKRAFRKPLQRNNTH